jgi:hypothetical protein
MPLGEPSARTSSATPKLRNCGSHIRHRPPVPKSDSGSDSAVTDSPYGKHLAALSPDTEFVGHSPSSRCREGVEVNCTGKMPKDCLTQFESSFDQSLAAILNAMSAVSIVESMVK